MFKFLKNLFSSKPANESHPLDAVTTPNVSGTYKVPEPAATTPIPYIPETPLVQLGPEPTVAKVEAAPVVESTPKPKVAAKPKAPAKPKAAKPVAEKAPAKPKVPKKPKISIAK